MMEGEVVRLDFCEFLIERVLVRLVRMGSSCGGLTLLWGLEEEE